MSYQVLARKWRPQRFDDVLGQQAVTRTLRNALRSGRLAHAFVFAGPRGCGKTTTARLLARALNCAQGPTADPCGVCEACVEIAEGRDIDVLEIDAATHTGVDNVREVIIEGLSIAPVRDRYKVFIVDEVHMLSASSFNALLKSIEEPPPHVVFMMATTELHKIPDTVRSRSQVYEFKTISTRIVVDHLRRLADTEGMTVADPALMLLARAGEGSMRDSLSALDQVRAFAGDTIAVEDVVAVLGLVGRDLVFAMLDAVAAEDAPAAFTLVEQAIERGYDLSLLCRELARATRDLLLVSVDPARASDPDVASEDERPRIAALVERCSREDLLRAFDVLTRAAQEVRLSDQPRFNVEMALLRLMHLRQLVPLADLIAQSGGIRPPAAVPAGPGSRPVGPPSRPAGALPNPAGPPPTARTAPLRAPAARISAPPVDRARSTAGPAGMPPARSAPLAPAAGVAPMQSAPPAADAPPVRSTPSQGDPRERFLAEVKSTRPTFYNMVVAQAFRIEAGASGVQFSFQPQQRVPRQQCEDARAWLEGIAEKALGQRVPVSVTVVAADTTAAPQAPPAAAAAAPQDGTLRQEAMTDPAVQALLEIFPMEQTRVEEV